MNKQTAQSAMSPLKAHLAKMDAALADPNLTPAQWAQLISTLLGLLGPIFGGIFGGGSPVGTGS